MGEYRDVLLTLSHVILPPEKLYPHSTPSLNEGLPWDVEYDLRLLGCELIQTACLLLKLPQTAVATGQVLFHRYFYSSSFIRRPMEFMAMACVTLAAKIEEDARRIRDVINVFHHIKQVRSGSIIRPLLIDQNYVDKKNEVIKCERRLLKELGFCVYVKHPHKMIALYLKVLEKERDKDLVQTAWNYMNDSLRTDIFLRFTPETIACACIDLAARNLQIPLPRNPPWYFIFGAKTEEIRYILISILRIYYHRPKSLDELEKIVHSFKEKRETDKKKSRFDVGNDSPVPITTTQIVAVSSTVTEVAQPLSNPVETSQDSNTVTTTTTNGKNSVKEERVESTRTNNNRHHHHRHRRHRRSSTGSKSDSQSRSRSPMKKKKTSYRSRSRSSTPKRRKHQKEKHYSSNHHRKKDRKRRSRSSSDETHKHPLSTKDTNNHAHSRSHQQHQRHTSKSVNGVSSSTSQKTFSYK